MLTLLCLAAALDAAAEVKVVKLWDNASAPHSNEITVVALYQEYVLESQQQITYHQSFQN